MNVVIPNGRSVRGVAEDFLAWMASAGQRPPAAVEFILLCLDGEQPYWTDPDVTAIQVAPDGRVDVPAAVDFIVANGGTTALCWAAAVISLFRPHARVLNVQRDRVTELARLNGPDRCPHPDCAICDYRAYSPEFDTR